MTDKTQLLFEWGDPRKEGTPYNYREWPDYLHHGFTDEDAPKLIELLLDGAFEDADFDTNEVWVPLYAWRILGQLQNADAADALLEALELFDEDDFMATGEIPVALGMIGRPALTALSDILLDDAAPEHCRTAASDGLKEAVRHHPELRADVLDKYREYLLAPDLDSADLNGMLIGDLLDLKAVELIEDIRDLYGTGCVKLMICGDLEDAEIELGFRNERSTPRPVFDWPGIDKLHELMQEFQPDMYDEDGYLRQAGHTPPKTYVRETAKVGRNDPCPCGSGKKYKRCCL